MKRLTLALLLLVLVGCPKSGPLPPVVPAAKNTLSWDRVTDAHDYRVYVCWMPNCDPAVIHTMLKVVPQTTAGVRPQYYRELAGSVGAYAVTARDSHGNESPFSVPLAFDRR